MFEKIFQKLPKGIETSLNRTIGGAIHIQNKHRFITMTAEVHDSNSQDPQLNVFPVPLDLEVNKDARNIIGFFRALADDIVVTVGLAVPHFSIERPAQ